MQPAPMTPDTLNFIRREAHLRSPDAIASELGWSLCRLRNTARMRCGIDLGGDALAAPAKPASRKDHPTPSKYDHDRRLETLSIDDIIQRLPPRQAVALATLRRYINAEFIDGATLAGLCNSTVKAISKSVGALGGNLERGGASWRIDTGNLGYRLITAVHARDRDIDSSMTLDDIVARLTPLQAQILDALRELRKPDSTDDKFVSTYTIMRKIHYQHDRKNIQQAISAINVRLRASRWAIEALARKNGGYRLVLQT